MNRNNYVKFGNKLFFNLPTNLHIRNYQKTILDVKKETLAFSNIVVYLDKKKGSNIVPGISDLDFVVACDRLTYDVKNFFSVAHGGEKDYILFHDALFLNRKLAINFGKIMGNMDYNWDLIAGKPLKLSKPSKVSVDFRRWDDTIVNIVRDFYLLDFAKKVNTRRLLHRLNSVRYIYTYWFLRESDKNFRSRLSNFIKRVDNLRHQWFEVDVTENLKTTITLLDEVLGMLEESFDLIKQYLLCHYIKREIDDLFYLKDPNYPIIFKKSKNYTYEVKSMYKKYSQVICFFPPEFFSLFSEYSNHKGIVSGHIYRSINKRMDNLREEFKTHAEERISFYNEQTKFCIKYGIEYGPLVNFELHRPPKSLKSKFKRYVKNKIRLIAINDAISNIS